MPKDTHSYDFHVVTLNDDSAVVAYTLIIPGEHPRYRRMADTWAKIDGQWKLKFRQITPNLWSANHRLTAPEVTSECVIAVAVAS